MKCYFNSVIYPLETNKTWGKKWISLIYATSFKFRFSSWQEKKVNFQMCTPSSSHHIGRDQ